MHRDQGNLRLEVRRSRGHLVEIEHGHSNDGTRRHGKRRRNRRAIGRNVARLEIASDVIALLIDEAREAPRSEEHTSELQSQFHLVCRLLLEKKKKNKNI